MTLARLATADLGIEDLDELLLGPTGLAFADGDPVGAAKVLRDFANGHEVLVIKGGLLGREFLTPERVAELADIEPREVLLARIAGAFEAPMAKMAGLLAALPRNAATMMQQLLEKKQEESSELPATSDQPEASPSSAEESADEAVEEAVVAEVEVAEVEISEVEEAAPEEVVVEEVVVEEVAEVEAEVEAEAAVEESDEQEAQPTESNDEVMAAEASDEDAGSESNNPNSAADDAAEEE
jgi:large subunit ribosomal protein L10